MRKVIAPLRDMMPRSAPRVRPWLRSSGTPPSISDIRHSSGTEVVATGPRLQAHCGGPPVACLRGVTKRSKADRKPASLIHWR
jgi:hypothetical protein